MTGMPDGAMQPKNHPWNQQLSSPRDEFRRCTQYAAVDLTQSTC